jgi:hypothetical protein
VQYALVTVAQRACSSTASSTSCGRPAAQVRNLPKPVWAILCFVPPVLGPDRRGCCSAAAAGLDASLPYKGNPGAPRRAWVSPAPRAEQGPPDDDEAFLRSLQERAEQQRRAAEEERRERGERRLTRDRPGAPAR